MADAASRRIPLIAYAIAILTIVADQASKFWVLNGLNLPQVGRVEVWPPFLRFSMVWNRGVSFGLFRSPEGQETIRWLLAAFAAAVSVALVVWAWKAKRVWSGVGIGFIVGGALGNLVDRVHFGAVADFIDVQQALPFFPWVFNVADSGVTIGVVILLIETFFTAERDKTAL